jgi:hypothetical protein
VGLEPPIACAQELSEADVASLAGCGCCVHMAVVRLETSIDRVRPCLLGLVVCCSLDLGAVFAVPIFVTL